MTSQSDIEAALYALNLRGQPVCVHSSLRSFGGVGGGPDAIIHAFLHCDSTLLVPTFSWVHAVAPPPGPLPDRNGYEPLFPSEYPATAPLFDVTSTAIDRGEMGALPAAVLQFPGHIRGNHPTNSFTAIGPLARELAACQHRMDVHAPLRRLAALRGHVLMMGTSLNSMTLIHAAEQAMGRAMFLRWAMGSNGAPDLIETGGCSEGFTNLEGALAPIARETYVGKSRWRAYDAATALERATAAIRENPRITHCTDPHCPRCNDAVLGGPLPLTQ